VLYAIHPVAGRMPGHMNVLLAEADVTNPAARTVADSPIYGMPILDVDKAGLVIVLKRSMASGFAGIDNPLFYDPKTSMVFGDAKASVADVVSDVHAL
jgi:NAD(P) transhydrogenase subunit beta